MISLSCDLSSNNCKAVTYCTPHCATILGAVSVCLLKHQTRPLDTLYRTQSFKRDSRADGNIKTVTLTALQYQPLVSKTVSEDENYIFLKAPILHLISFTLLPPTQRHSDRGRQSDRLVPADAKPSTKFPAQLHVPTNGRFPRLMMLKRHQTENFTARQCL
jgi:hypothetical protein